MVAGKLVCVSNLIESQVYRYAGELGTFSMPSQEVPLEIGKVYDCMESAMDGVHLIIMPDGTQEFYPHELFEPLDSRRQSRIDDILK